MDSLKAFFNTFRCAKGETFTHTSIGKPSASLYVPNDRFPEFYANYHKAMVQSIPLHLTEKPTDPSPMRIDLDFRFSWGDTTPKLPVPPRMYNAAHVERIMLKYFQLLATFLDAPDEAWIGYVMEKKNPVEYRGKIKDGIHVVWPHLVVANAFQHLVRKHILDDAPDMFQGMPLTNPFEDVIDQAIIDKNNWQMYGSSKPDCEAYRVTRIYMFDRTTSTICLMPPPSAHDELTFVELFSMRGKEDMLCAVLEEKQEEIEEYIRHVLPTMDDRRKNKLHAEIFGKSTNLTRTFISDDELVLARKLVTECLNPRRAESYEDWIKLGWALRNIDSRLIDSWIEFSRVSSKYIEGECQKLWNQMRSDTLSMGTLRWWARQDNPMKFEDILAGTISDLVDKCIGTDGAHYDVAKVVFAMYKDKYRFTTKDTWYMYREDMHRWVRTREGLKLRLILSNEVCLKFMERAAHWLNESIRNQDLEMRERFGERNKKLLNISTRLKQAGYKDSIMKECKSLFTDEKFEELLDSHPHLLGFENGIYDLRMHEFRDGLPDDYVSFSTGRNYNTYVPDSHEAIEINTYLSQVFTNENVRNYMIDILSCILDGSIRQEKFYIFTGSGSNSKSLILNFIQHAIGEYYCILPIALLTQKRTASNSAQSELERTKGRRLAVMQEPGESEKLNIGLMKELTGGDRILVRGLYKEPVEFRPQFKMVMTCNELPEVPSDDGGTWRRIRVVEYTSKFCESPDVNNPREFPMDSELNEKIERWADTFISMLIHRHGTIDPKDVVEPVEVRIATEGYKKNNDVIGQFMSDKLIRDDTATERIMLQKLYIDFRSWCANVVPKGKKLPDRNQLKAYMEKLYGVYSTSNPGWKGVRYVTQQPEENRDTGGDNSDLE